MISTPDRVKAIELIDEAVSSGARRTQACEHLGICDRTCRRWTAGEAVKADARPTAERAPPSNKLTEKERQKILDTCHQEEFVDLPPGQIVPRLADRGEFIGSESSFYRVLDEHEEQHHRGSSKAPQPRRKPTSHCANLYLIMDIFSRKITGWEVHECELGEYAASLVHKAVMSELCVNQPLVLHADNGAIQKGSMLRAKLEFLGVTSSFSRPRVSNDNPYSVSLFRTCKYCPAYPDDGFASIDVAREWMSQFVRWYNNEHRHSGIKHVTPSQRHNGLDKQILEKRKAVYEQAKHKNPNRWSSNTRNWEWVEQVWLNPENQPKKPTRSDKMAA